MKNRTDISNRPTLANYDTRKVLNRSTKPIPDAITNEIEAGTVTIERIKELAATIPIFVYQTCITIHGNFGTIERTRIGGYKNIHQNQNGSLEIRYNAIDTQKKREVKNLLSSISSQWNCSTNSTGTTFELCATLKPETQTEVINHFKQLAEAIRQVKIYGNVSLYTLNVWGMTAIYLTLRADAIPADLIQPLAYAMTGHNAETFKAAQEQAEAVREAKRIEREAEDAARKVKQEERQQIINEMLKPLNDNLETLPTCSDTRQGIAVRAVFTTHGTAEYKFFKSDKGNFGKLKFYTGYNTELKEPEQWTEQTQDKADKLNAKYIGTKSKLFKATTPAAPVKQPTAPKARINTAQATGIVIEDYSDRAIAIFGDTRPIKDKLSAAGGRFNAYLQRNGQKTAGWIFSKTKREQVEAIIN